MFVSGYTFISWCDFGFGILFQFSHVTELFLSTAFEVLLKNLPDLVLDTPDAATVLGNFIARAVADDCLPPKFVQICKEKVVCDHAR
jgi:programmed cell death protein 4